VWAVDDHYTVAMDTALDVPYEAGLGQNDVKDCSGGYSIDDLTQPAHGTVTKSPNQFGAFSYTLDPGYTGPDSFSYSLIFEQVEYPADVLITVDPWCTAIGFSDYYSTPYETVLGVAPPAVLGNDTLTCAPTAALIAVPPEHGTLALGADGSVEYTPDAGFWGYDEFVYEVRDVSDAVIAGGDVFIEVELPLCSAADDAYSTAIDTGLAVPVPGVLANDLLCPNFDWVEVDQPPANGSLSLALDGSFVYTPDPGFVGQDVFSYQLVGHDVIDDGVTLDTAVVTVDVGTTPESTESTEPPTETTEPATETTEPAADATEPVSGTEPGSTTTTTVGPGGETSEPSTPTGPPATTDETPVVPTPPEPLARIATFDVGLSRDSDGELLAALSTTDDVQAGNVAEILQRTRPDIVLLGDIDLIGDGASTIDALRTNYLLRSQNGAEPIDYPYAFVAPSNTGVPSGFDLDHDGTVGGPADALGPGDFVGQHAMVLMSRYPIVTAEVRTFQHLLWASVPGARLPDDPATPDPGDWYSSEEQAVLPLSSTSHWDVPIDIGGRVVHLLASRPTAPGGDGAEDRNGTRNADEIGFWADYVASSDTSWIVDDAGAAGGLAAGAEFVIVGDLGADPVDGDAFAGAAEQLLALDLVHDPSPSSVGGVDAEGSQAALNLAHAGDPALDTADLDDAILGNLRTDYVLPSDGLAIVDAAVFWPTRFDPLARLVAQGPAHSTHRLVWVDLA